MKNDKCMHDLHQILGDHCMPKNGVHAHMHQMHRCNTNFIDKMSVYIPDFKKVRNLYLINRVIGHELQ